jgi:hypothetical protein
MSSSKGKRYSQEQVIRILRKRGTKQPYYEGESPARKASTSSSAAASMSVPGAESTGVAVRRQCANRADNFHRCGARFSVAVPAIRITRRADCAHRRCSDGESGLKRSGIYEPLLFSSINILSRRYAAFFRFGWTSSGARSTCRRR